MSKYTSEQLNVMANHCLEARDAGDDRYLILVLTLAQRTGLHPTEVEQKIVELAAAA